MLKSLLIDLGDWEVWVLWYDYVFTGSAPAATQIDEWEAAFVDLPEPLPWTSGAFAVNSAITSRLKALQSITTGQSIGVE